jgi:DNA-binding CsgD family transcriptional regulator
MTSNHLEPYLRHAADIKTIVALWEKIGILGVFYTRIYPDGTCINLANNAGWTTLYFEQLLKGAYANKDVVDQCFANSGASLWALNLTNPIWQDGRHFSLGNGITISKDTEDFQEFIGFYAAADNNSINHFYINHLDKIKNMREHFLSQASHLIKQAEKERLLLARPVFSPELNKQQAVHYKKSIIPNDQSDKNTSVLIDLPPQRRQCLTHLANGKSSKQIARTMNLSPRTVDHYLHILRQELGCRSSRELMTTYGAQLIHTYYT